MTKGVKRVVSSQHCRNKPNEIQHGVAKVKKVKEAAGKGVELPKRRKSRFSYFNFAVPFHLSKNAK